MASVLLTCAGTASNGFKILMAYLLVLASTVDNLFVFILVFNYLKVPRDDQNKVGSFDTRACVHQTAQ